MSVLQRGYIEAGDWKTQMVQSYKLVVLGEGGVGKSGKKREGDQLQWSHLISSLNSLPSTIYIAITIQFTSSVFAADYDPTIGESFKQVSMKMYTTRVSCDIVSIHAYIHTYIRTYIHS